MKELRPGDRVQFFIPKTIPPDLLNKINERCKMYGNKGFGLYSLILDGITKKQSHSDEQLLIDEVQETKPTLKKGLDSIAEKEDDFFSDFGSEDTLEE